MRTVLGPLLYQGGTGSVRRGGSYERDYDLWMNDLINRFKARGRESIPGPQFSPKDVPEAYGPAGELYYDPEVGREDEDFMAARGTDTVPAKLTPREAVLNRNAAELAGRGYIRHLNNMGNELARRGVDLAAHGGVADVRPEELPTPPVDPESYHGLPTQFRRELERAGSELGGMAQDVMRDPTSSRAVQTYGMILSPMLGGEEEPAFPSSVRGEPRQMPSLKQMVGGQIREAVNRFDFDPEHGGAPDLATDLHKIGSYEALPPPLQRTLDQYHTAPEQYENQLVIMARRHAAPIMEETQGYQRGIADILGPLLAAKGITEVKYPPPPPPPPKRPPLYKLPPLPRTTPVRFPRTPSMRFQEGTDEVWTPEQLAIVNRIRSGREDYTFGPGSPDPTKEDLGTYVGGPHSPAGGFAVHGGVALAPSEYHLFTHEQRLKLGIMDIAPEDQAGKIERYYSAAGATDAYNVPGTSGVFAGVPGGSNLSQMSSFTDYQVMKDKQSKGIQSILSGISDMGKAISASGQKEAQTAQATTTTPVNPALQASINDPLGPLRIIQPFQSQI